MGELSHMGGGVGGEELVAALQKVAELEQELETTEPEEGTGGKKMGDLVSDSSGDPGAYNSEHGGVHLGKKEPMSARSTRSFNRDVRPILSERCFACHGPDAHERKAKLRLDRATGSDGAYRTRGGSAAIQPGSLDDSELWYRITTSDADDGMPPPASGK